MTDPITILIGPVIPYWCLVVINKHYALARSRSERDTAEETEEMSTELAEIKCELDELAAELDDDVLFDVALGKSDEDRR